MPAEQIKFLRFKKKKKVIKANKHKKTFSEYYKYPPGNKGRSSYP